MSERMTVAQAKALADDWKEERDQRDRAPSASYFSGASAHEVIQMFETGKGTDGKRLTKREFGCLVERWVEVFGKLPPRPEGDADDAGDPAPLPAGDTMLRADEVERLTGLKRSTLKRMVSDGRFPEPLRIGKRARGWLARDVRKWIDTLDEQRRRPKH